ncbi:SMI1/KNR4 family protein [Comamonas sp.]|uniref:SMI1/KNR4 family protein n=1 Tax=Comamonas sp. TaxID=34028 RepID=UPI00289FCA79|nr:SMI1/KNR4 family protein [Comamonas sp.]
MDNPVSKIEVIFESLIAQDSIFRSSLLGCNSDEIRLVEKHFECLLPDEYRYFLQIAGRSAGKIFQGTDIFYPRILELKDEAQVLLVELDVAHLLPADAKIFCMHQGYEINYFLPGSSDPPIFQFFEGQLSISQPWASLSEYFRTSIEDHLTQWLDLDKEGTWK